jgi:hypothetical protein
MRTPPPEVVGACTALLEWAILNPRMRLRYNDDVTLEEVHDILDASHNVPSMLQRYGGWNVEENIDWHLAHYDEKWMGRPGSELRTSLIEILKRARAGEFEVPSGGE